MVAAPASTEPRRARLRVAPSEPPVAPDEPHPSVPVVASLAAADDEAGLPAPPKLATKLLRLGRAHAATLGVVLVVALVLAGTRLMAAQGHDIAEISPTPMLSPAPTSSPASPTPPPLRVHVLGAVMSPGVVQVPAGSRVADVIAAAGGLAPDADCGELNLAAPVPDGAQIIIGTLSAPRGDVRTETEPAAGPAAGGGASAPTLNLNTATQAQLESLPGVGPVTAQRIVAWRDANGGFTRVEELQEVDGIGPKTYAQLAPLVHV